MPETEAVSAQASPDGTPLITRRHLIGGGLAVGLFAAAGGIGMYLGRDGGPTPTERDIVEGIEHGWQDVAVFAGGLVLGSEAKLNRSPDFGEDQEVEWPAQGQVLGVRRPVMVAQSADMNGYASGEIDPNVMGLWLPGASSQLVFARYNRSDSFWPIYRGRDTGYTKDLGQMVGEAVMLEPGGSPRHFIVERPEYKDKESRTRRKDVGQSAAISPTEAHAFVRSLEETHGGFEIRDWVEYSGRDQDFQQVDEGYFDDTYEISDKLTDKISRGLESDWSDINVFGGVVGINKTSSVFSDPRLAEGSEVEWPKDYPHAVVVRPMFVVGSSRINIDGEELEQVEKAIRRTAIGFWLPGPNQFVYMDTQTNSGNMIPIARGFYPDQVKTNGILGYDVSLDGREAKGGVSFPYFNDEYSEQIAEGGYDEETSIFTPPQYERRTRRALVGHSLGFSSGADAVATLDAFSTGDLAQPLILED